MKKYILSVALLAMTAFATAQTSKSTFIHMKSGEVKEIPCTDIDSITFGNHVTYDKDFKAEYVKATYYGGGQYMIHLSDAPISSTGLPTQKGQIVVRFDAFNVKDPDGRNAVLPEGTYTADNSFKPGTLYLYDDYLCAMVCTGMTDKGPDGYSVPFSSATLKVKHSDTGYVLEFTGDTGEKYEGVDFQTLRVTYAGEMKFDNQDSSSYTQLEEDVTMVPTMLSGRYSVMSTYGNYSIALLNCPLDDEGFVVGAGELLNLELLTNPSPTMDINDIAGEYTVTSVLEGPYNPGSFLSGTLYEVMTDYYLPMGTYYTTFDSKGATTNMNAFITGGSVKVLTDGTNVTFMCNLITENDKHVNVNFTAPASGIIDQSQSSNGAPARRSGTMSFKPANAKSNYSHTPALRLIRK